MVSERGRPTTISHLPSSPSASLASGFRYNHYVTHPLAFPHWVALPLSLSLSGTQPSPLHSHGSRYYPALISSRCRSLLCEGWFDYSCTTLTILFSSRFSFYRLVISYRNGPSIPPTVTSFSCSACYRCRVYLL